MTGNKTCAAGMTAAGFRNEDGVTAVEFAILLPPFLMLMLAIMDLGLVYFANSRIERGVFTAQQTIAQAATRPDNINAVRGLICQEAWIDCNKKGFVVEVVPLTASSPQSPRPPADAYDIAPGQPHIIRVLYPWNNLLPTSLLQFVGLERLARRDIQVGVFFHPNN